ncbi:NADH-cytochrome B5 reductase [Trypanosoma rangeli]|uniref:NADH-cytochrome b5 reductase n=1 Tax=Trypanosoma rangeli TaxID=5698 RepID=A0A3R7JUA9_TRYRA|nr:NADH-cytochrome B5 reductase [Trypanosoma rangeli]RNE95598.1 NADH-cytochrome B5 reductase [Trypanosoma rangeli]|eukprot:RNE95598.1 NADH-cytochrome B5 reductase [Trypanosoma rangeli]
MLSFIVAAFILVVTVLLLYSKGFLIFGEKVALDASKYESFKLVNKIPVSHNSFIFRFGLHSSTQRLGLPIGQHIYVRSAVVNAEGKSEMVQHAYTPVTSDDDVGYVDFLIKVYFKNVHPKFPNGGRLSQHLYNLPLGSMVEMRGPVGKFVYLGNGNFTVSDSKGEVTKTHADALTMVAGGTGITPMMQLIRAIMKSPEDRTEIALVYANQTEEDILLRKELDECARDQRMTVWYMISRDVSPQWKYGTGHVDEATLRAHVPVLKPKNHKYNRVVALMCGPPMMVEKAVRPNLGKLGYANEDMFAF